MDEVAWTRRALRNLEAIGDHISEDNPEAAARIVERIALMVSGTPYIVIYQVKARVEIPRIRHGAQRWPG